MRRWIHRPRHSTVVAYTALALALSGGTAYAASSGYVHLGSTNTENTPTTIQRATPGTALNLRVGNGYAPLTVNTKVKVGNLNADLLDGKDSSKFQPKIGALHFDALTLTGGWGAYSTVRAPGVALSADGVVRLRGQLSNPGSNGYAFTLPTKYRPSDTVFLTVDECSGTTGRIILYSTGQAYIQGDPSFTFANSAGCFTSLDGLSYTR